MKLNVAMAIALMAPSVSTTPIHDFDDVAFANENRARIVDKVSWAGRQGWGVGELE